MQHLLDVEGQQEPEHAGRRGQQQQAQHAEREHPNLEQREVHDRAHGPVLVRQQPQQRRHEDHRHDAGALGAAPVEDQRQHDGQHDEERRAEVIDGRRAGGRGRAALRRSQDREDDAERAHRHQQEEDPAPVHQIDHQPAERRADQEPAVERHRHVAVGAPGGALVHRLHGQHARRRRDHRGAESLDEAKEHEPERARREAAQQRADRHDREAAAVDHVASVDVTEPAEHDREADPRELIRDERPRDHEDVGVERGRDRRQRDDEDPRGDPGEELAHDRVGEQEPVRTSGHGRHNTSLWRGR